MPYAICHMTVCIWHMENDCAPEFLPAQFGKHLSVLRLYIMKVATEIKTALILATYDQQSGKRHPVDRIGAVRTAVGRKRRAVRPAANNRRAGARNQSRLRNRP